MRIIDRVFGFFIATGIVIGCACLALEYIIVKGPSPSLSNAFVMTMLETRRFKFIPRIYLTGEEVKAMTTVVDKSADDEMDTSLINIGVNATETDNETSEYQYDTYDEDGTCYGLIYHIGILVDGTIIPCCLDSRGDINLGNIYENNLDDILMSERVKNIINNFKNNKKCEELCKHCKFIEK